MTTITKKIVDGFIPNYTGTFLGGKGRTSSCFVTIGRGMWKNYDMRRPVSLHLVKQDRWMASIGLGLGLLFRLNGGE